jgi:hypothetical protein
MSDWLGELRASLDESFDAIWATFDADGNGELDAHELDHLVAEMLKVVEPNSPLSDNKNVPFLPACPTPCLRRLPFKNRSTELVSDAFQSFVPCRRWTQSPSPRSTS